MSLLSKPRARKYNEDDLIKLLSSYPTLSLNEWKEHCHRHRNNGTPLPLIEIDFRTTVVFPIMVHNPYIDNDGQLACGTPEDHSYTYLICGVPDYVKFVHRTPPITNQIPVDELVSSIMMAHISVVRTYYPYDDFEHIDNLMRSLFCTEHYHSYFHKETYLRFCDEWDQVGTEYHFSCKREMVLMA